MHSSVRNEDDSLSQGRINYSTPDISSLDLAGLAGQHTSYTEDPGFVKKKK